MKRKRYLTFGLVLVSVGAIVLAGWAYAGSAGAMPGNTCNPQDFRGASDKHPRGALCSRHHHYDGQAHHYDGQARHHHYY